MLFRKKLRLGACFIAAVLSCLVGWGSAPARAQSTTDDLARRHFDSGVAYLEESDYDSAIVAFQKSYDLSRRSEILLNLATVYERKSDLGSAVAALRAYLDAAPDGEHVTTVKLRLQNLEKRLEEQQNAQAAAAPPPPPIAAQKEPAPASTPLPAAERSRLPAFIALGVGGLMAGGALTTGIIAQAKYDDAKESCGPYCRRDELSSSRTLALTSTVLTGAAALGIGLGVVLLLTTPEDEGAVGSRVPRWNVAVSPQAAAASAAWAF